MPEELLSAGEAARRLGVAVTTLYDWLGRSDRGRLVLRGRAVRSTISRAGPRGKAASASRPARCCASWNSCACGPVPKGPAGLRPAASPFPASPSRWGVLAPT